MKTVLTGLISFIAMFSLAFCNGHTDSSSAVSVDTAKLFDPMSEKTKLDFSPRDIADNCMGIRDDSFIMCTKQVQLKLNKSSDFENYINSHITEINGSVFYILYDSSISKNEVVSVIKRLKKQGVEHYVVVSKAELESYHPGSSNNYRFDEKDMSNFVITLSEKGIDLKWGKKIEYFAAPSELDNYILKNKTGIDTAKIYINAPASLDYSKFLPVKKILMKNNLFNFNFLINSIR